jgi:maleate cis-trans isomerase
VSLHVTKLVRRGKTLEERVECMTARLGEAHEALLDSRVDAIAYGCMVSCLVKGTAWERDSCRALSDRGVPFQTAAGALRTALVALGARKVAVFSPYREATAARIPEHFAAWDVEVIANLGREALADPHVVGRSQPEDLFRDLMHVPRADALCILATDLPTFEILPTLEVARGAPVVTSNQALLWWLLRAGGVTDELPGLAALGRRPACLTR